MNEETMPEQNMAHPAVLALGLLFLILGYTNHQDALMVIGLLFGIVGLGNTLPLIKQNLDSTRDEDYK